MIKDLEKQGHWGGEGAQTPHRDGHARAPPHVQAHAANTHDTASGCSVFEAELQKYLSLKGVCADAGYRKTMEKLWKNS